MADIFDSSFDSDLDIEISDNKIVKGEEVNLTAKDPTMTSVLIGVGWDLNAFDVDTLDLDVSCFLLNKNEKTRVDADFVFYNNTEGGEGSVIHNGDSRTGAGEGDDETISIDLNGVSFEVMRIVFVLSIYKGEEKEQTMASLRNSYIRIINASDGQELLRYELSEDVKGSADAGMLVGSLNREGPKWHFKALGESIEGGLAKIATDYDIIVHTG
ncbi:MAG: chemical-damaging agent resistance protein C [Alphaproteobacteria bacterium]|nr:MAG: chemical-damaging agent resistance protein C [Alphaproteobacteria bacterium]